MKNKKGSEMSIGLIITIIIILASFIVLLFFWLRANPGGESEKDVCHNSVVIRGNSIVHGLSSELIPLKCYREYVCITKDGSCDIMAKPYTKEKVKTKEEVYKILADKLADCWWMFGEGKMNYVGKDFGSKLYCSFCSQIAFDDSVKEIFGSNEFNKEELYLYMKNKNMTAQEVSYLEYLYGSSHLTEVSGGSSFGKINLSKQYIALMAIYSDVNALGWVGIGAGVGVMVVISVGTGGTATIALAGATAGAGGYFLSDAIQSFSNQGFLAATLIESGSPEEDALKCKDIVTYSGGTEAPN